MTVCSFKIKKDKSSVESEWEKLDSDKEEGLYVRK